MKLFYAPGACSLAPHIVLREAQLPFQLERVNTSTHKTQHDADYYAINPKGYVPLLELDNGERLSEGPVISQYISDQAGNHDLMPAAGTTKRYRVMEWQNYVTSELHKSFSSLFNPAIEASAKSVISTALRKKFDWVSSQLEGKQYLTGDAFTAADAYLFTVANWSKHVGLDLSGCTHLLDYLKRVAARPAVKAAMQAEGLLA
ncbi:glutathione transferase GstA [Piscinibacter sp.]|jgi:glutathione S-transferase|uniref:glutathione transferase GstA n=1 Tax=Piscinibacter sp. TaxID=1903157 RepID=UPI002F3F282B